MTLRGAWKDLDLTVPRVLWDLRGLIVSSGLMGLAMVGVGWLARDEPKIVVLLLQCVVGVLVYTGAVAVLAKAFVAEVLGLVGRGPRVAA